MPTNRPTTANTGFVLLLTLVVISVILAIGLSLLEITMKQTTLANIARESEISFHAASTGLECMQYWRNQPGVRANLLNETEGNYAGTDIIGTVETTVRYEAEDCSYSGDLVYSTSASGDYYVDYRDNLYDDVICSVSGIDGEANLVYRNRVPDSSPMSVRLYLNGVNQGTQTLFQSFSFNDDSSSENPITLTGSDDIRVRAHSGRGIDLDYIELTYTEDVLNNSPEYQLGDDDTSAPPLTCAGNPPLLASTDHASISGGESYNYQYTFQVDDDTCVETSMYLTDARDATADMSRTINEGLDSISCDEGSVCTVIFARGFNRSCDNLNSLFTVQRELTIEY